MAWKAFIPCVIQSVNAFLSSSDLEPGARWGEGLDLALEEADIGILCLTQDNKDEPWILFEAGALAKKVGTARVVPFLLDLTPGQLKPPLGRFNAREFKREDVFGIVGMIRNQHDPISRLGEATFKRSFNAFYPRFEKKIKAVPHPDPRKKPPKRTQDDILEEILTLLRHRPSNPPRQVFEPETLFGIAAADEFGRITRVADEAFDEAIRADSLGDTNKLSRITTELSTRLKRFASEQANFVTDDIKRLLRTGITAIELLPASANKKSTMARIRRHLRIIEGKLKTL